MSFLLKPLLEQQVDGSTAKPLACTSFIWLNDLFIYLFIYFSKISKTVEKAGPSAPQQPTDGQTTAVPEDIFSYYEQMDKEEEEEEETQTVSFEIRQVLIWSFYLM